MIGVGASGGPLRGVADFTKEKSVCVLVMFSSVAQAAQLTTSANNLEFFWLFGAIFLNFFYKKKIAFH